MICRWPRSQPPSLTRSRPNLSKWVLTSLRKSFHWVTLKKYWTICRVRVGKTFKIMLASSRHASPAISKAWLLLVWWTEESFPAPTSKYSRLSSAKIPNNRHFNPTLSIYKKTSSNSSWCWAPPTPVQTWTSAPNCHLALTWVTSRIPCKWHKCTNSKLLPSLP